MNIYSYEGRNIDDVKEKALSELGKNEEDLFINVIEDEAGLFKTKRVRLEIISKEELLEYLKGTLIDIVNKMGIEARVEAKKRKDNFKFTLFSNNNSILIGKGGRTIESLQIIIRHIVSNKIKLPINITLDVEDYREKQIKKLEFLARKTAKEVLATGIDVKLDSMNSYERRIVHEEVAKIEGVHTISEGEEPNRYVVIKVN
ncbi:MAG TPA: KH domain-containing protein [Mollicutes bacterium]|nr:KH domain-containing protein [Mollicutes bacterium]